MFLTGPCTPSVTAKILFSHSGVGKRRRATSLAEGGSDSPLLDGLVVIFRLKVAVPSVGEAQVVPSLPRLLTGGGEAPRPAGSTRRQIRRLFIFFVS